MPIPEIKYEVDETTGSCSVTGATYLLSTSLAKIGVERNHQNAHVLCFTDELTQETIPHLLQKLCDLRGWNLLA